MTILDSEYSIIDLPIQSQMKDSTKAATSLLESYAKKGWKPIQVFPFGDQVFALLERERPGGRPK